MTESKANLSRREFLARAANSAGAFAVVSKAGIAASAYQHIYLPRNSELPVRTAASELAAKTGANVVPLYPTGTAKAGDITLVLGSDVSRFPEAQALFPALSDVKEWEVVQDSGNGLVIAGSTPRNVCHAALAWIENPTEETNRFSAYQFDERFTMWDNSLNQWYRFSKGFDRRRHIREIARLGHTGVEINRYADPGGYHVRHRKFPQDSYAWYMSYAPALDAFVESSLTRGIYPSEELAANLSDLLEAASLARSYGLKPGYVCYEPRGVAEEVFDRHPGLRGSRIDHPGRSLQPRYALDIAHPRVLEHYAEMLTNLMEKVPDLRYFVFWTQDSGSGIPFTRGLYFGPNGSYRARSSSVGRMVADFSGTLLEAGRRINPEFEVIMEIGWEYSRSERREITAALPEVVTLAHTLGGRVLKGGEMGDGEDYFRESRQEGVEPYATVSVSAMWEAEPIMGVARPSVLLEKMAGLKRLNVRRFFTNGGVTSPPLCPFHITQELYLELLRRDVSDLHSFLQKTATRWCDGDSRAASSLVEAWETADRAIGEWPLLNWYHAGAGQTQGRWITRPLVPDITRLDPHERSAWERALFTLPWDIGRPNIVFEGGIRMYQEEQLDNAVRAYDEKMLPGLEQAVGMLDRAVRTSPYPVLEDQRDRYRGFLLRARTVRNLFDAQVAINRYLLKQGELDVQRDRLKKAIEAEMTNTREWIQALKESRTPFFRVTEVEETPFLYKTPVSDLELKLKVMEAHRDDEPGPYLKELAEPFSERNLLFYFRE